MIPCPISRHCCSGMKCPQRYLVFWERTTCNANLRHNNYLPAADVMLLLLFCVWEVFVCVFSRFFVSLPRVIFVCVFFLFFRIAPGARRSEIVFFETPRYHSERLGASFYTSTKSYRSAPRSVYSKYYGISQRRCESQPGKPPKHISEAILQVPDSRMAIFPPAVYSTSTGIAIHSGQGCV